MTPCTNRTFIHKDFSFAKQNRDFTQRSCIHSNLSHSCNCPPCSADNWNLSIFQRRKAVFVNTSGKQARAAEPVARLVSVPTVPGAISPHASSRQIHEFSLFQPRGPQVTTFSSFSCVTKCVELAVKWSPGANQQVRICGPQFDIGPLFTFQFFQVDNTTIRDKLLIYWIHRVESPPTTSVKMNAHRWA